MESIGDEISFKKGGIMENRAHDVLIETIDLLHRIEEESLFKILEKGIFAGII